MSDRGVEAGSATGVVDDGLSGRRFLTGDRIAEIGALIAPLLTSGTAWIDRRKESVQILDDSALRRQVRSSEGLA